MAEKFDHISDTHRAFIEAQHIFFTGTAAPEGRVNISPKGMDSLRVLGPNRILWMNFSGSGNETAGHLRLSDRMTLMWCSFEKTPMIMRAYGHARTIHQTDADWEATSAHFALEPHTRQIFDMTVEVLQTSCGFAVPFMSFEHDRPVLSKWAEVRGKDYMPEYWRQKNTVTIDGYPTGILEGNLGEGE